MREYIYLHEDVVHDDFEVWLWRSEMGPMMHEPGVKDQLNAPQDVYGLDAFFVLKGCL
jgi:hypothetical protein